eukprot:scaffold49265_cov71-Phaeocystis_antarctica.AAC.4
MRTGPHPRKRRRETLTQHPQTLSLQGAYFRPFPEYVFGQNMTENNPAPSPSGHPLLSGPPTLTDIRPFKG